MTRRLVGAFVAAAFAIGLVGGAASTIVAHDAPSSSGDFAALMADHMAGYDIATMMSGSMMDPGSSFGPGMMTGPDTSPWPGDQHDLHHLAASPDGAK